MAPEHTETETESIAQLHAALQVLVGQLAQLEPAERVIAEAWGALAVAKRPAAPPQASISVYSHDGIANVRFEKNPPGGPRVLSSYLATPASLRRLARALDTRCPDIAPAKRLGTLLSSHDDRGAFFVAYALDAV